MEQFSELTKRSLQQYINDLITDRLKSALKKENSEEQKVADLEGTVSAETVIEQRIETTPEEMEGFLIVKTILRQKIKPSRITYRDAQSYFAILLDDNNRKTICRLYLNANKKYLALMDENKKEIKKEILSVDDLFEYSDNLLKTAFSYDVEKKIAV